MRAILKYMLLTVSLCSLILLVSCFEIKPPNETEEPNDDQTNIVVPDAGLIEREYTHFDEIVYERPDCDAFITALNLVTDKILNNVDSYQSQLNAIYNTEDAYTEFLTAYSYLEIMISRDSSNEEIAEEYRIISTAYPDVVKAIEDMMVAAASSPHNEYFENDYFGEGLIEEYGDGGKYSDEVILLMKEEAELESQYSSLSTANIEITYQAITGTLDELEEYFASLYGEDSYKYESAMDACYELYYYALDEKVGDIFVELVRVRRLIADGLGYDSYATYAYETLYHDYEIEKMESFIDDISEYVIPAYIDLEDKVLYSYFSSTSVPELDKVELINNIYELYTDRDDELAKIYAYMLASGFYDVEPYDYNRTEGAFTTYLYGYQSPFVFMTTYEDVCDYLTLAHEFGHFADYYLNADAVTSLDMAEVSSQALEYMTLEMLKDELGARVYRYLLYYQIQSAFYTLIFQGFYANFEHQLYEMPYDEISEESISALVRSVAREMGLPEYDVSVVYIDHILLYPFYVQSYCTSIVASLDIYFAECENEGDGVQTYKELLLREGNYTFEEELWRVGLDSPFEEDKLKEISNKLYYQINGYYYHKDTAGGGNVA